MPITGRQTFDTSEIRAIFYQGPWAEQYRTIDAGDCFRAHGRLCIRVRDDMDPSGWATYAQGKPLRRGYGVPERWQTIDPITGLWTSDKERYWTGDYNEADQQLPWEEHGAEAPGGGSE